MLSCRVENSRRGGRAEFGDERRRATDVLILMNVVVFALQLLSKDVLTLWGCKVKHCS